MTVAGLALAVLLGAPAGWDSPSQWVAALARAGHDARWAQSADLGEIPPNAGLALLRPRAVVDPTALRLFVQGGGRVLLAAEGAADDPALAAFQLRTGRAGLAPTLGEHPALLTLPLPSSGVFVGVDAVVTNHPTAILGPDGLSPAATFPDGTPFAWRLRLGEGDVLALGDASLFINLMRPVAGNRRLADGIGAWLAADGRPVIVLDGPLTGQRLAPPPPSTRARINTALAPLTGGGPAPGTAWIIGLASLAGLLTLALAWLAFPGRRLASRRPAGDDARVAVQRHAARPGGPAAPPPEETS